jgi:hypothetical protein
MFVTDTQQEGNIISRIIETNKAQRLAASPKFKEFLCAKVYDLRKRMKTVLF